LAGIIDIGVYIPWRRLSGKTVGEAWGRQGGGERAVLGHDEDSATMAVSAALSCIGARKPQQIDILHFASVSPPYAEKSVASLVAAAADMGNTIRTGDHGGSLRAATSVLFSSLDSLKAGAGRQVMVCAADSRQAPPGSTLEMTFGDAGAAVLVGNDGVVAEPLAAVSHSQEILDTWRTDEQRTVRTGDARFNRVEAFAKCTLESCKAVMEKAAVDAKQISKAVITSPDGKGHGAVAKPLGLDPKALVDPRTDALGMLGTAQPFVSLAAALESANAGDRVLLACYGDGCDAVIFEVKEAVQQFKAKKRLVSPSAPLGYVKFLAYRKLLAECGGESNPFSSAIQASREAPISLRFHGKRCQSCGTINTLSLRVCPHCGTRDRFDDIHLAKKGTLNTYTQEHYFPTPEPPITMAVVDLEGGGRYLSQMTDVEASEVKVGMQVEMTFRRLHDGGGYHNYCWKCKPIREVPNCP
jgi:3-hydroxy-3-methylglutaryl CoA synthase